MEFCAFDEFYLERLRAGDFRTQEHFVAYFSELIKLKARSHVRTAEDVEDIRQETFSRVFKAMQSETGIRQPERLGAFVNSICRNVLFEYYRSPSQGYPGSKDEEETPQDYPDASPGALDQLVTRGVQAQVHGILDALSEKDRKLIREVLLEERSKDEVCQELGVDRDYLRVLLHRAKQSFKEQYSRSLRDRQSVKHAKA